MHQPKPKIHSPPLTLSCFPSLHRCCLHLLPLVPTQVTLVPLRACSWWGCSHQAFCRQSPTPLSASHGRGFISQEQQLHSYRVFPEANGTFSPWQQDFQASDRSQIVAAADVTGQTSFAFPPVPKTSLFLSLEPVPRLRQGCPSTTTLPPAPDVSPIHVGLPRASAQCCC